MDNVIVISESIQEFLGERFYKCGYYFQHNGKRLHRTVWEHFNGEIPKGFHVHHIDGNRANNEISNLALVDGTEHVSKHAKEENRRENGRKAIKIAIEKAPEWHRSEEGKEWHSKHAKEYWKNMKPAEYDCTFCGTHFVSKASAHKGNHFCSGKCKAAYRRRRIKLEQSCN